MHGVLEDLLHLLPHFHSDEPRPSIIKIVTLWIEIQQVYLSAMLLPFSLFPLPPPILFAVVMLVFVSNSLAFADVVVGGINKERNSFMYQLILP